MNIIKAKQKALESLIQRIVDATASEYDIRTYDKLKSLGIIK